MEDSHSDAYETDVSDNNVNSQAEFYTLEGTPRDKGKKKASDVWNYFQEERGEESSVYDLLQRTCVSWQYNNLRVHLEMSIQYGIPTTTAPNQKRDKGQWKDFFQRSFVLLLAQKKSRKRLST